MAILATVINPLGAFFVPELIAMPSQEQGRSESESIVWKWGILPAFTLKKPSPSSPPSAFAKNGICAKETSCRTTSPPMQQTRLPPIPSHAHCLTCPGRISSRSEADSWKVTCPLFTDSHHKKGSLSHAKDKTATFNNNIGLVIAKWPVSNTRNASTAEHEEQSAILANNTKPLRLPVVAHPPLAHVSRLLPRPPTYNPSPRFGPVLPCVTSPPNNEVTAHNETVTSPSHSEPMNAVSSLVSGTDSDAAATPTPLNSSDGLQAPTSPVEQVPQATATSVATLVAPVLPASPGTLNGKQDVGAAANVDSHSSEPHGDRLAMLTPAERRVFTARTHLVANLVQSFNAKSASVSPVKQCSVPSPNTQCASPNVKPFLCVTAAHSTDQDPVEELMAESAAVTTEDGSPLHEVEEQLVHEVGDEDSTVLLDIEEALDEVEEVALEPDAEGSLYSADSIEELEELRDLPDKPEEEEEEEEGEQDDEDEQQQREEEKEEPPIATCDSEDVADSEYREPRRRSDRFLSESFNSGTSKDFLGSSLTSNYFHDYQKEITSPAKIRPPSALSPIPPPVQYPDKIQEQTENSSPVLSNSTKRKLAKLNINQHQNQEKSWDHVVEEDLEDRGSPPPIRMQHSPVLPRATPIEWSPPTVRAQPVKRSSSLSVKSETKPRKLVNTKPANTSFATSLPISSSTPAKPSVTGTKTQLNQTRSRLSQTQTRKSLGNGGPRHSSPNESKASLSKTFVLNNNNAPVSDPQQMLQTAMKNLQNEDWEVEMDGIQSVARLAACHPDVLLSQLHAVNLLVINQVKNLRSQVSRAAIQTFVVLFEHFGRNMEQDMDKAAALLFLKTGDTNKFIREDSNAALDAMVDHVTPAKAITTVISEGASHKNGSVRTTAARLLSRLVDKLGASKTLKDMGDKLLPTAAQLLQDGSQDTRNFAKKMFVELVRDASFDKLLERHLQPAVFRNVEKTINSIKSNGLNATHRGKMGSRFNTTM